MTEEHKKVYAGERPEYQIRKMREEDLSRVMVIEEENFSVPWSEKSLRDTMLRREAIFLVAEGKRQSQTVSGKTSGPEEILGFAGAVTAMDQGDVTNIAVLEKYKRCGIATDLLKQLIRETMTTGVRDLFLEVREHNIPALRLYQAAGFAEVGRRRGYYDKPREDALLMKRSSGGMDE